MSHGRAQLLTLPLTWRYLLTTVDARNLKDNFLSVRAAMLLAKANGDTAVTMTALPPPPEPTPEEREEKRKQEEEQAVARMQQLAKLEQKEEDQNHEIQEQEDEPVDEDLEESDVVDDDEGDEGDEGDREDEGDRDDEDAQNDEGEDEEEEEEKHSPFVKPQRTHTDFISPTLLPSMSHATFHQQQSHSSSGATPSSSSAGAGEHFSVIAEANERAARGVINEYTRLRDLMRNHANQFALLQQELAALDPSMKASQPQNEDLTTFEAFMEYQRANERSATTPEGLAATTKRLENEKQEGGKRFARNTAKLISLAAPILDTNTFTADPDVASALQECSASSGTVSQMLGHPVATLALTCAQMVGLNLVKPKQSKDSIYATDRWRRYVAQRQEKERRNRT